jgi:hypothetical protein
MVQTRLFLGLALLGCLAWLTFTFFRHPDPDVVGLVRATSESARPHNNKQGDTHSRLEGAAAQEYLKQTEAGQSLTRALMTEQYGLKWQQKSPFGVSNGGGYLGMSHDENLNAWFDEEGVTVRPTLAEKDRDSAWQLGFKLKGFGYGKSLLAAPPIVKREVQDNRIEYVRSDYRLAETGSTLSGSQSSANPLREFENKALFPSAIGSRQSTITEWYENRPQGIEQGFTINTRPERSVEVGGDEPLRLHLEVSGDLRARARDEGQEIELVDKKGKGVLSYGKLSVVDADGKQLTARMEAEANGRKIRLVVEDEGAHYPIVIDPIVATLEQVLVSMLNAAQTGAQSGWAVAIQNDFAVVGAPFIGHQASGYPPSETAFILLPSGSRQ